MALLPMKPAGRVGLLKLFATLLQLTLLGGASAGEFGYCVLSSANAPPENKAILYSHGVSFALFCT